AFGQGRVLVSPLAMASVAASVARGYWKQPRVLLSPSVKPVADGPAIADAPTLRQLMREVVVAGTGLADAPVPREPGSRPTGTRRGRQRPTPADPCMVRRLAAPGRVRRARRRHEGQFRRRRRRTDRRTLPPLARSLTASAVRNVRNRDGERERRPSGRRHPRR